MQIRSPKAHRTIDARHARETASCGVGRALERAENEGWPVQHAATPRAALRGAVRAEPRAADPHALATLAALDALCARALAMDRVPRQPAR